MGRPGGDAPSTESYGIFAGVNHLVAASESLPFGKTFWFTPKWSRLDAERILEVCYGVAVDVASQPGLATVKGMAARCPHCGSENATSNRLLRCGVSM